MTLYGVAIAVPNGRLLDQIASYQSLDFGRRQHNFLHWRSDGRKICPWIVAGAAAEPADAVPVADPCGGAVAVDRADGAVGDRFLVDLRPAILDHFVLAGERAALADDLYRLSARPGMRGSR